MTINSLIGVVHPWEKCKITYYDQIYWTNFKDYPEDLRFKEIANIGIYTDRYNRHYLGIFLKDFDDSELRWNY